MKIYTEELKSALAIIKSAINPKSSIPALTCALVKDGYITGFDLTTALSVKVGAEGELLIPHKAIELINTVTDSEIDIEVKDTTLTVKFGRARSKFTTILVDEYPLLPEIGETPGHEISMDELNEGISKVFYATAVSEAKPIHTGIRLTDGEMVAIDGVRLAIHKIGSEIDTVIPRTVVPVVKHLSGNATVYQTQSHIVFETDDVKIITRRLSGEFLDHKKVLPSRDNFKEIDRKRLVEILSQIKTLQDDKIKKPCKITADGEIMKIEIQSSTVEYSDELGFGGTVLIGVNVLFLLDALKTFSEDSVSISFGKEIEPILIKNDKQTAMILPVRLK